MAREKGEGIALSTVVTASQILELLSREGALAPSDIARQLSLARSNVHRLLATLNSAGYTEMDERGRCVLTFGFFELGNTVPYSRGMIATAKPAMLKLAELTGATVSSGVFYQNEVLLIDRVDAVSNLVMGRQAGATVDPLASSLGKVLLAFLPPEVSEAFFGQRFNGSAGGSQAAEWRRELQEIRERRRAYSLRELSQDLNSLASPVLDSSGAVVFAIAVSGPADRFSLSRMQQIELDLLETVKSIAANLK